jgi:kumamolisin
MPVALALLVRLLASASPAVPVPDSTPVHVAIDLRLAHPAELEDFRRAQRDPGSADYGHFLTPQEFGRRFGPSAQVYGRVCDWLREAGFTVTEFPNRLFVEGAGTAAQVTKLLGVRLLEVPGQPATVHVPDGAPRLPPAFAKVILHVSGLDTRVRYRHHVASGDPPPCSFPHAGEWWGGENLHKPGDLD